VTGAAMFVRREVAETIGMDGSYFLGAEDSDLCVRAARAGRQTVCRGDGSRVISGARWHYYSTRNRVWWTRANFGIGCAILNWLWELLSLLRVLLVDVIRRRDLTLSRLRILALRN